MKNDLGHNRMKNIDVLETKLRNRLWNNVVLNNNEFYLREKLWVSLVQSINRDFGSVLSDNVLDEFKNDE